MSVERLARNGEAHRVAPEVAEMTAAPSLHTVVVTCMDARIDLFRILGLDLGEVHILRNAGAVVTDDVLRSLVVSQQMLGTTEIMLIGHTTCGLCGTTEEQVRAKVREGTGQDAPFMFGSFDDLEASVRDGVRRLRRWTREQKPIWACIETSHIGNADVRPSQLAPSLRCRLMRGQRNQKSVSDSTSGSPVSLTTGRTLADSRSHEVTWTTSGRTSAR